MLFHRYTDGSKCPIANASKMLADTQCRYSQIQKEAVVVILGLNMFHQFIYGRNFILVIDHKLLFALLSPSNRMPALAANCLAQWALTLSQCNRTIKYQKTVGNGNADALSCLPAGNDVNL